MSLHPDTNAVFWKGLYALLIAIGVLFIFFASLVGFVATYSPDRVCLEHVAEPGKSCWSSTARLVFEHDTWICRCPTPP